MLLRENTEHLESEHERMAGPKPAAVGSGSDQKESAAYRLYSDI